MMNDVVRKLIFQADTKFKTEIWYYSKKLQ